MSGRGWRRSATTCYACLGAAFGCCFPVGSLAILWWSGALSAATGVWDAVVLAHRTSILLAVIDTAPLFLGWFAALAGARQDRISRLAASLQTEVAERARAHATLAEHHALLAAVMEGSTDALWVKDRDGTYRMMNGAGARALGRLPTTVVGRTDADLFAPAVVGAMRGRDARVLDRGRSTTEEELVATLDGRERAYLTTRAPLHDDAGHVVGVIGISRDVTEQRALEERLAYQATHDALTGLANRALFRDRAEQALARVARSGGSVAVLFLDLDDFKTVNDGLGHAEGDRLLEAVARRLLHATRGCDTVARLGGDEFAVLLDGMHAPDDALVVVERVRAALRAPAPLRGREVLVRASIGLVHARPGDDADALLRDADAAMYHAKAAGKGRHAVFEPGMHAAAAARLELEADLRLAAGRDELRLAYQPIVELATGRVVGFEALLRWRHPARGDVPPATFIPIAEASGLIVPIGRWVLDAACRQLRAWSDLLPAERVPNVSVNVSGRQLEDDGFVPHVAAALAGAGVPADRLTVEVTESVLVHHADESVRRLAALETIGVQLAVDDFGTGYSALAALRRYPLDVLKIDKAFVDGIAHGGDDAVLARAIVTLGGALGLRTVAEGVETDRQRAALVAMGCAYAQGYLFGRPGSADDATARLTSGRAVAA